METEKPVNKTIVSDRAILCIGSLVLIQVILVLLLIGLMIGFLIFGRKEDRDIYQAIADNRAVVCHIESFDHSNAYIQYETDEHIIMEIHPLKCYVSLTTDPQPKAEYYYKRSQSVLYISLPWNDSKTQYDIPVTALNVKYDRRFQFKRKIGRSTIGDAEPYYMKYYPDSKTVDVWAYTGDGSNRLYLYKVTPVLRTDIETIECVNGEIRVPFDTHKKISRACK